MAKEDCQPPLKAMRWIGSAKDDLSAMSHDVKDEVGFSLEQVQAGKTPTNSGQMKGKLRSVREIRADDVAGSYRALYTTQIGDIVYVLDVFQKKSKSGIATPRRDLDRIEKRLKTAREHYEQTKR